MRQAETADGKRAGDGGSLDTEGHALPNASYPVHSKLEHGSVTGALFCSDANNK